MKRIVLLLVFLHSMLFAQTSKDYSVLLTAEIQESPPKITLHWPSASVNSFTVFRKSKSAVGFGSSVAVLPGTATSFVDSIVSVGTSYEYSVRKNAASYYGYGYINAGIKVPELDIKGRLILLVDSSQATALSTEIDRLIDDMEGEGWSITRFDFSPNADVMNVKLFIKTEYDLYPDDLKAVFILGHLPVPYSGNISPDGHTNHVGAWPCDAYYGEMNGTWTDNIISNTSASDTRNRNVPNDGKFDQSIIPSSVELQVGRVDLYDMPAFSASETELLRNYLNKNHAFRTKQFEAIPRALIDDNFGGFSGEAFGSSAWKAFAPMFGPDSIVEADYFTTLSGNSYLWSYGCGGGTYTSAGGIGNTTDFAADSLQTVFTALFGSYFGDWDKTNSFLKAPLAQGNTLTNAWSGRPHWHFHHMALGENIGYSYKFAVNPNPYFTNYASGYAHIALMGDPTLKMHIVAPPSNLQLSEGHNSVDLTWTASPEPVLGYHVYRKINSAEVWKKLTDQIVPTTTFTDTVPDGNVLHYYAVRAVKLEETPSGSYYNMSGGALEEIATKTIGIEDVAEDLDFEIYPNPTDGKVVIQYSTSMKGASLIEVYSMEGKKLHSSVLSNSLNSKKEVDLSELDNGFYLITFISGEARMTKKLVISKN